MQTLGRADELLEAPVCDEGGETGWSGALTGLITQGPGETGRGGGDGSPWGGSWWWERGQEKGQEARRDDERETGRQPVSLLSCLRSS